ncbi:hybrid sensor histidine kinase/response regulator [Permianibacter aggregans]|uniref:histidine kinase n=1 Tax=Permianibacter aggregans TaxID=1510150 RepID=A0A4R6UMU2_9GAMM|nr:hybrid sensor histidine kinase/response regulator [Permianibacter aggregans]QGX40620.1 response regulator [Permianibacter aggregans]TDQ46485.1 signal transduction histidine kinase [Permianibacter aggregans]
MKFRLPAFNAHRSFYCAYVSLLSLLSYLLAIHIPHSVPYLLGNMGYLVLLRRLGWFWSLPPLLLAIWLLDDHGLHVLCVTEWLLTGYFDRHRRWSPIKATLAIWSLLLPVLIWYAWPSLQLDIVNGLLIMLVLLITGIGNRFGTEMSLAVSQNPTQQAQTSLREQLAGRVAVFAAAPMAILLTLALHMLISLDLNALQRQLGHYRMQLQQQLQYTLKNLTDALELSAAQLSNYRQQPAAAEQVLHQLQLHQPALTHIRWRHPDNQRGAEVGSELPRLLLDDFPQPISGTRIGNLQHHIDHDGNWHSRIPITTLMPASGPLYAELDSERLRYQLSRLSPPAHMQTRLLDAEGNTLLHVVGEHSDTASIPENLHNGRTWHINSLLVPDHQLPLNRHNNALLDQMPLAAPDWQLLVAQDLSSTQRRFNLYTLLAAGTSMLLIWLIHLAALRFMHGYTAPLHALVRRVRQIDFQHHGSLSPISLRANALELQELIDDFNRMLTRLTTMHQELSWAIAEKTLLNRDLEWRVQERTAELQQEKTRAEQLAQIKARFLATMSHELRTPLSAIIGFSEQLQKLETTPETQRLVDTVLRNAEFLLALVNDILDTAKLESGKMKLEQISFSLLQLTEEVVHSLQPRAQEKSLSLRSQYQWPLPAMLIGDPLRIRQILFNLLGNALKFTHEGIIELRIECHEQRLQLIVSDTGIGISEAHLPNLFNAFSQSDSSTTRQFGGTGLGLHICQQLCEMMGGRIEVSSDLNCGSVFTVTLPLNLPSEVEWLSALPISTASATPETVAAVARVPTPIPRLRGHVLIADDVADLRLLLRAIIEPTGVRVSSAQNGREVLAQCAEQRFDLLILDMNMPEMDGMEATRQLRQQGFKQPIIALSADVQVSERAHFLDQGCDECLGKPVDRPQLYALMQRYLPAERTPRSAPELPAFLLPLKEKYRQRLPADREAMHTLMANQDWPALQRLLHQMKGSAGSFMMMELSTLAGHGESLLKQQQFDRLAETISELDRLLAEQIT